MSGEALSGRGHGTPGLLSYLRPSIHLFDDGNVTRVPFLELGLGREVPATSWTLVSGAIWTATINFIHDSLLRDAIGIQTDVGILTRVETQAAMTAGTYYCPVGSITGGDSQNPRWDSWGDKTDNTLLWDDGIHVWDAGGLTDLAVYVWLPGGQDPRAQTVIAILGFYYSTIGSKHPWFGPNKLVGADPNLITNWTISTSGTDNVSRQDDSKYGREGYGNPTLPDGSQSVYTSQVNRITLYSGGTNAGFAKVTQTITQAVAGEMYRISGTYLSSESLDTTNLGIRLRVGNPTGPVYVTDDGQTNKPSGFATLTPTEGEERRFIFDIVLPAGATQLYIELSMETLVGVAARGSVTFSDLAVQRIYRFNYYEPRLTTGSLPSLEVSSQDIFFGGKTMGLGTLKLQNADGNLTPIINNLLCDDKPAGCWLGGFQADGLEVFRDDWQLIWPAYIRKPQWNDKEISFEADDARNKMLDVEVPLRTIGLDEYPNADLNSIGYPKPYRFIGYYLGSGAVVIPRRVDKDASTGYGTYLIIDPSPRIADFSWANFTAFSYSAPTFPNRSSIPLPAAGTPAVASGSRSNDQAAGTVKILSNIIDLGPSDPALAGTLAQFDFNIGAGTLTALIFTPNGPNGTWTSTAVSSMLQTAMRAISGAGDINVTYSETTHFFTVSKGAGTLQILIKTGPNAAGKWWNRLGLTNNALSGVDYTGALSYTSDVADFTDVDQQHAVLTRQQGYVDDASGTITGVPNDAIHTRAAIAHFLLRQVFGFSGSQINTASFYAGHQNELATEIHTGTISLICCLHLEQKISIRELFSNLEKTAFADLYVEMNTSGTDWRWRWRNYAPNSNPVAAFYDRDFLSFHMWRDATNNVYSGVKMAWGQNPATKTWDSITSIADRGITAKYGRRAILEIQDYTHGTRQANARILVDRFARLAAANPRMVEFESKRKALVLNIGDIIALTRSRAMDSAGNLNAVKFRVLGYQKNAVDGVASIRAVEDVAFW